MPGRRDGGQGRPYGGRGGSAGSRMRALRGAPAAFFHWLALRGLRRLLGNFGKNLFVPYWLFHLHFKSGSFLAVALRDKGILSATINPVQEGPQFFFQFLMGWGVIRGFQPVIDENLEMAGSELNFSRHFRLFLQKRAG